MEKKKERKAGGAEAPLEVTVTVRSSPPEAAIRRWTSAVRATCGARHRVLSLLICGDQRIRGLNRRFRRIDRPTDVLSFPSDDEMFLGDLAIDVPYALRQARRRGHGLDREIQILLTHGILHLMGHDHETDDGTMFRLQARVMTEVFGPGPDGVPEDERPKASRAKARPPRTS